MDAWACAACSGDNAVGLPYCGACGARDDVERDDWWGCRGCGQACGDTAAFCGRCGLPRGEVRPEDLRLVTALFADISGFTTLADTLDVEDLHAVINPLIAGLAGIAERYDGFIAKYAGDALLCLFGAPTQHEDDAQRALLAALEMQATLPQLLSSLGDVAAGLTIHVGVNTGKVVAGAVGSAAQNDYSVLGDSVILAQRLESACPSGQTYVGESTYDLCKDEFDFEDVGELQLKGKLTIVRGFRLIGRRRAGTDASRPLVGRDTELEQLLGTVQTSGVCVLIGEPGAGKSRLLAEARVRATADGHRWLPMRCLSYGAALPYWPFTDLLRQALGLRVEDAPEDIASRLAGALPVPLVAGALRLLGTPLEEERDLEPEAARRQVHDTLVGMLSVLSGGRPLVLAVEDVHWIDSGSADALAELIRTPGVPLGVVLTCREEGRTRAGELAAEAEQTSEVVLSPLGPESVPLVASAVLGSPVAAALAVLLVERTRGNPLFVEELARSLSEDGALVPTSAGFDLRPGFDADALPDTVERVFAARVDSLPLAATSVLLVAAVVGRVIRLSLLEQVAREEGTDLAPLTDLVAAGLLDRIVEQDEPAVSFHHALLHDAVYGRLLKKQRRSLHRRVADAGRRLYGDGDETVDLLARHLYLAEAGEEAVEALLRAGRRAARLYANDAAAVHLAHAVEVLDATDGDGTRRVDVRRELASVQELRGAYAEALAMLDEVVNLAPAPTDCVLIAMIHRKCGQYDAALDALGPGLTNEVAGFEACLEAARNHFLAGRTVEALEFVRRAGRLQPGSDDARAALLMELIRIETETGHPEFAVAHGRQVLPLLRQLGDQRSLATALRMLGGAQQAKGQFGEATALLREAVDVALRIGHVEEAAGAMINLGLVLTDTEDFVGAVEITTEATGVFERLGHGSGRAVGYGNIADALCKSGDFTAASTWADKQLQVSRAIGHERYVAYAVLTLAEIDVGLGALASARGRAHQARALFADQGSADMVAYCDDVLAQAQPVQV